MSRANNEEVVSLIKQEIIKVLDSSSIESCLVVVRPFYREILLSNINNTLLFLSMHPRSIKNSKDKEDFLNEENGSLLLESNLKAKELMDIQERLSNLITTGELEWFTCDYLKSK